MKKISFALPCLLAGRQNMVRADLSSGSLAVWNARGEAAFARPPDPSRAQRGSEWAGKMNCGLSAKASAKAGSREH